MDSVPNIKATIPKMHIFAKLLPKTLPITTSCFLYLNMANKEVNISGEDEAKAKYIEPIIEGANPKFWSSFPTITRNSEPAYKRHTPMNTYIVALFFEKTFLSCSK